MNLPRDIPAALSTLSLALGLTACVSDNADSGLTVLRAATPESGCSFNADATTFLASGLIQADSEVGYLLAPVVRNDLSLADGEAETPKTVFVSGAQVTIKFYDTDLFTSAEQTMMTDAGLSRFLAPLAGSVEPNAGVGVFPFEAVPPELLARIKDKLGAAELASTLLDVQVTMVGTRGGSELESNLFRYPVEVCASCVVHFLGNCSDVLPTQVIGTGGVCSLLQDGRLDCCWGADPDDLEVDCPGGMLPDDAPAGSTCQDNMDEAQPAVCPARPIEL